MQSLTAIGIFCYLIILVSITVMKNTLELLFFYYGKTKIKINCDNFLQIVEH